MMNKNGWYEEGKRRSGITLRLRVPNFEMWISNQHIDHPGYWVGTCVGLFSDVRLKTIGKTEYAQDAQEELMTIVIEHLAKSLNVLRETKPLKIN